MATSPGCCRRRRIVDVVCVSAVAFYIEFESHADVNQHPAVLLTLDSTLKIHQCTQYRCVTDADDVVTSSSRVSRFACSWLQLLCD